ncbi:hypothetical protein IWX50DRAFT_344387 [Phyllosticta citricarpa]
MLTPLDFIRLDWLRWQQLVRERGSSLRQSSCCHPRAVIVLGAPVDEVREADQSDQPDQHDDQDDDDARVFFDGRQRDGGEDGGEKFECHGFFFWWWDGWRGCGVGDRPAVLDRGRVWRVEVMGGVVLVPRGRERGKEMEREREDEAQWLWCLGRASEAVDGRDGRYASRQREKEGQSASQTTPNRLNRSRARHAALNQQQHKGKPNPDNESKEWEKGERDLTRDAIDRVPHSLHHISPLTPTRSPYSVASSRDSEALLRRPVLCFASSAQRSAA